jgi:hypothetical protein
MTPHTITQAIATAWPYVDPAMIERATLADLVITADAPMELTQARDLALFGHAAITAVQRGAATDIDVSNLAVIANLSMLLAESGVGAEALPDILAGMDACNGLRLRHQRTGRAVATGPELQALCRLIDLHDEQLHLQPSARQMRAALGEMRRRMAEGRVL